MTRASREQHINHALIDYRGRPAGTVDTTRVPLRGRSALLEVIDLPLDTPILNADSFRIAPALADHPKRELVYGDPESPAAQAVVAELVRAAHRHADLLKESILLDGQDQPGVITRSGKLINANTRCVLLRELVAEGSLKSSSIRVAVLPADTTNSEQLGLESVLQQQVEHKDDYNLVSKLMMIEKLYTDAGMTDKQIAVSLREKNGHKRISELREVLVLMNRARNLTAVTRPITVFVTENSQQQNWLELLYDVREIENKLGRDAANDHIRGWLLAFYTGFNSVHHLRSARGNWVERDVVGSLTEGDETAVAVAQAALSPELAPIDPVEEAPAGLEYLTGGSDVAPRSDATSRATKRLLDAVVEAKTTTDDEIELADGEKVSAEAALEAIRDGVKNGLDLVKGRMAGKSKLVRPQAQADSAYKALKAALEALEEVVDEPDFRPYWDEFMETMQAVVDKAEEIVNFASVDSDADLYATGDQ